MCWIFSSKNVMHRKTSVNPDRYPISMTTEQDEK